MTEPRNLVHNSPVGILQKRRGGKVLVASNVFEMV